MNAGTKHRTLGELFHFKNGRGFKKTEWANQGLPIIRIQNLNDETAEFNYYNGEYEKDILIQENDLLFSWSGTVGSSFGPHLWSRQDGLLNQHIFKIGFKTDMEPRYAYFALEFITEEIERSVNGAVGLVHITKEKLNQFTIPVPPLSEQRRIVAILDEAFEGIATARANAEKNRLNARAVFDSAISAALGRGGVDWMETTIGHQMQLQRGFDITKDQQRPGSVPVVSSGGIKSYHDTAMATGPGVVLGRKGTLGKVFYVEEDYWPHDTSLWVKDFKGNHPRFVYYFLRTLDVTSLNSGAANPALNRNQVHPIKVSWPPFEQQVHLTDCFAAIEGAVERLESIYEQELTTLDELKQSLLHRAFNGDL